MSNDIVVSAEEITRHRKGIIMQLQASGIAKNHDSFAAAMDDLNMWAFVENQAEVNAAASAYNRKLYNIIHDNTHASD